MLKFYGYFRSSAAYRCRIAFNLKEIEYDLNLVHLRKNGGQQKLPDYINLNPQALIPSIKEDDFILTQSMAIIEWIDEKYPEPKFIPKDINMRALVRAFSQIIACDIHPLQNLRVLEYLTNDLKQDQKSLDKWCQRWLGEGLAACEKIILRHHLNQKFCFGNVPTLADICLVPQIFSAQRFGVDLSEMPNLMRIFKNCSLLDAFNDAHPLKQPDAEN